MSQARHPRCILLLTYVSSMTIGWIEEWVNDGTVRDGLDFEELKAGAVRRDAKTTNTGRVSSGTVKSAGISKRRKLRPRKGDRGLNLRSLSYLRSH